MGTRATAAPGPAPAQSAAGLLGESRVNGSLPFQTRFEQHQERPGCLKSQGGAGRRIRTSGKSTETVYAGWGELSVGL